MAIKKDRQKYQSKKSIPNRPELKLIIGGKTGSVTNKNSRKKQGEPQFQNIKNENPKQNLLDPKERKIKNVNS